MHHDTLRLQVYIMRVPTKLNIGDIPSRPNQHTAEIMARFGAVEVEPKLHERYMQADTWEVLVERWHAHGL